jgi:hypothetical protein
VLPEDHLVVTKEEIEGEKQNYIARVDPVKGVVPPPYRPLDLTQHVDPRPDAMDPEVLAKQARDERAKAKAEAAAAAAAKAAAAVAAGAGGKGRRGRGARSRGAAAARGRGDDEDGDEDDDVGGKGEGEGEDEGEDEGGEEDGDGEDYVEGDDDDDDDEEGEDDGGEGVWRPRPLLPDGVEVDSLAEKDSEDDNDDDGIDEYDEMGRPTLRSPTHFFRHDSEDELLGKLAGTKPVPVLSPSQYRKMRGVEAKLQKPDNEDERRKAKRKHKRGAGAVAMRAKLATLKFVRQLFGKHVVAFAKRNLVAEMRYKARVHARRAFRKDFPPIIVCPRCPATFGLYRPFRRHFLFKCPKNGNGERHPTIRRA